MTRVHNDPAQFKDDMLAGFTSAYARYVEKVPKASGVMRGGGARHGKVSVIIGGGCGHYPAFSGLVGAGLADGSVVGDIFTSPSTEQAHRVAHALDGGAGILFSFGNYAGDVMNFGVAQERLHSDGIACSTVLVTDDVASASVSEDRRGIAGTLVVFKVAGAAAARGEELAEVERLAHKSNSRTRTLGVAFAGCTFPGQSEPLFEVPSGSLEVGLGIHGEPGIRTVDEMTARDLAGTLVEPLLRECPVEASGRVAVLLNGLGATKYEELFVLWKDIGPALENAGVEVVLPEVGEFVTSLDMAGCSLTMTWLDDELEGLWCAPADTPAFRRGDVSSLPHFEARGLPHAVLQAIDEPTDEFTAVLARMLQVVTEQEDELGWIDAVAGDGDHGTGMTRGLRAATEAAQPEGGVGSVLRGAGRAWADKAGGTSGLLWGLFLESIGDSLGDSATPTAEGTTDAVQHGLDAMRHIGKAEVGDKTMLDALTPFVDALRQAVGDGQGLAQAWSVAAETATLAAHKTAELRPRVGRARPLAERSVGTPDAGAISLALCAKAAGDVLTEAATDAPQTGAATTDTVQ